MINQFTNQLPNNNSQSQEENFTKELELDNDSYIVTIKKVKPSQISIKCENKFDYLATHDYSINLTYDEFCKLARTFRLFDNIDEIFDTIKNLFKGVNFSFQNDYMRSPTNSFGNQFNNTQMNQNQMNFQSQSNFQQNFNQHQNFGNNQNLLNIPNTFNNQQNQNMPSTNNGIKVDKNVILQHSMNDSVNLILKIPLLNEKYEQIPIELKKEKKDIKKQFEKLKNKFLKIKKIAFSDETESNNIQNNQNNIMMQGNQGNFGNNQGFNNFNNPNNFGNNQGFNNFNNPNNFNNQGFQKQSNFNRGLKNNKLKTKIVDVQIQNSFANMNLSKPSAQTILDQIKNEFKAPASDNNILFEFNQNII